MNRFNGKLELKRKLVDWSEKNIQNEAYKGKR